MCRYVTLKETADTREASDAQNNGMPALKDYLHAEVSYTRFLEPLRLDVLGADAERLRAQTRYDADEYLVYEHVLDLAPTSPKYRERAGTVTEARLRFLINGIHKRTGEIRFFNAYLVNSQPEAGVLETHPHSGALTYVLDPEHLLRSKRFSNYLVVFVERNVASKHRSIRAELSIKTKRHETFRYLSKLILIDGRTRGGTRMTDPVSVIEGISKGLGLITTLRNTWASLSGNAGGTLEARHEGESLTIFKGGVLAATIRADAAAASRWDQVQFDALYQRLEYNWSIYHRTYAELPTLSVDERSRVATRLESSKREICRDLRELVANIERASGKSLRDIYTLQDFCGDM